MNDTIYKSAGIFKYEIDHTGHKAYVLVDKGLSDYYRSLIPKYANFNRQKYDAHISVVRKETPKNLDNWGKYQDQKIDFYYSPIVKHGMVYIWLDVYSTDLEKIRLDLGLPVSSMYTRPPDGWIKCFHMTLGNFKGLNKGLN